MYGLSGKEAVVVLASSTSQNQSSEPLSFSSHGQNHSKDRVSFAFAVFLNFFLTVLCLSVTVFCLAYVLQRYLKRREERDKLCSIISSRYWLEESRLLQAVQVLSKLRDTTLFQDVTAYSVVCYKYRSSHFKSDQALVVTSQNGSLFYKSQLHNTDVYGALKSVERFFDSLSLQLLCRGKCPDAISRIIGPTVFHLARETCLAWTDLKSPLVHKLVGYFSGSSCAEVFRSSLISDNGLASMVMSRVPYVASLTLNGDCLVLKDVDAIFDGKVDLSGKIRFVDVVLARADSKKAGASVSKDKILNDSCQAAKEICSRLRLLSEGILKHMDNKGTPLINVRHMLRIMCHSDNVKLVQLDDKFFQFLMRLHEGLYGTGGIWPQDVVSATTTAAMLEVMDRTRSSIVRCIDDIIAAGPKMADDREMTRLKLEQIERELQQHLNYLILKQVQKEGDIRLNIQNYQSDKLVPAESDLSIYTMAQSSSYALKSQAYRYRSKLRHIASSPESIDQTSSLSGASSMYATAASLSSPGEISLSPLPRKVAKGKSVTLPASDSEQEGFETPV